MFAAIVICNGIIRSGSTWSFNVCRELAQFEAKRLGQPFASCFLHQVELEYFMRSRAETPPGPAVIKAHMIGRVAWEWIGCGRAKAVLTYRDPRDCVASDKKFARYDFDSCALRVLNCLKELPSPLDRPHVLFIPYEEMMANTIRMIRQIASHLGVEVDETDIRDIDDRTNIDAARRICQEMKAGPASEVIQTETRKVDEVTQLHHNHIDSARIGRWKDDLTPKQAEQLNQMFRPWLLLLKYETQETLASFSTSHA